MKNKIVKKLDNLERIKIEKEIKEKVEIAVKEKIERERQQKKELKQYISEVNKIVPLSRSEEEQLAKRIEKGDKEAKEKLTRANLRYVIPVARKYYKRTQPLYLTLLELIQEGNLGLLRAIKKFDWGKNQKFSTYATWWIRQAITRRLADQISKVLGPKYCAILGMSYTDEKGIHTDYFFTGLAEEKEERNQRGLVIKEALSKAEKEIRKKKKLH